MYIYCEKKTRLREDGGIYECKNEHSCVCEVQCMFSHMWICEDHGLWNIILKSDKRGLKKINIAQEEKGNRHFIGKTCFFLTGKPSLGQESCYCNFGTGGLEIHR